ncbi:G-protein coupled receptor 157-like [Littorina saxatilis]|uniref:G-protein coupled receptors family 2 profile 2 domain-containing protein n=1 Tax=Littorina saxatilis TaxID=31220 RepID=A0AAN9BAB3_9CAEN
MRNVSMYPTNLTLTSLDAAYIITTNLTCVTSICGCLSIIGLYLMYPDIRTTARKLLVCLSVANFIQCVAGLLQAATYYKTIQFPNERKFFCEGAASTYVIGQVASALWTCAVTIYLFLSVSLRAIVLANKLVYLFYVFCFGMPLIVATAAGVSDVYGYDVTDILYFKHPTTCWISDRVSNTVDWYLVTVEGWVIATYYLSIVLFVVINCSIYCKSRKTKGLNNASDNDDVIEDMAIQTAARQLRYVPLIYCLLRVWGTGHFLFTEYPTKRHLRAFDWLLIIRAFGDNAQGLANCILFCVTTKKIRRMVARRTRKCCSCFTTWCQRQQRRLAEEKWMPQPIVRMRRTIHKVNKRRSIDGSDLDISGISLELPSTAEELEEVKYTEDEVLFER